MTDCATFHASHPVFIEDEIAALALQLEEIGLYSDSSKGKSPIDHPPDVELAFASFQSELEQYRLFLNDVKLAQSIDSAVHADAALITDITTEDFQAHEDRNLAIQMSSQDPELTNPPPSVHDEISEAVANWMSTVSETLAANSVVEYSDDEESEAGPSMTFLERQASVFGRPSRAFECCACTDRFPAATLVTPSCGHRYCIKYMKHQFLRASKDETYFPPRCCKQEVLLSLVAEHLSAQELDEFNLATVEYSTTDRVYCSNLPCNRFIPPAAIEAGTNRAVCEDCDTLTCSVCKNAYHDGEDCPDDPTIREIRDAVKSLGLQTCYRCKYVVELRSGCYHMTCRCKAQFCYLCGVEWKNCACELADEARMMDRAEEVVDRDAPVALPPAERQRQVQCVHRQLQRNHRCHHPGKFERVFGGGKKGFGCEMCDVRHRKYILRCRHCLITVCEDCRRTRV